MRFIALWRNIRGSFWYLPALYSVVAFILALLTIRFDFYVTGNPMVSALVPSLLLSDKGLAQAVLSSISSSLLTMTTITFSTILVVLTTFLSNFSPRTLQNFITDHSTQRVLGSFVGGFVYSVVLLLLLRETDDKSTFISPTFAIAVTILCLAVFVFFVHHTSLWIQVGNLIFHISTDTSTIIKEQFPPKTSNLSDTWSETDFKEIKELPAIIINSPSSGYIDMIDEEGLMDMAIKRNCIIRIERRQPDFVDEAAPLFSVWNTTEEELIEELYNFVSIGPQRAPYKDVEFGLRKLAEIALRAISPAVNDPNTAINSIEQIGNILTELGKRQLPKPFRYDDKGQLRLIMEQPIFMDYLYASFYQIRHYSKEDISVIRSIVKALTLIAESNDSDIQHTVWEFSIYIIEGIDMNSLLSLDKRYLNDLLLKLAKACQKQHEFKLLQ
ncbi:DUF2254 domain-containing protein [Priestia abyssalis]|uniref:DUF2254 domain-containing protein n=1 Tax=Priestia abyssalis TaxID=1221450 RepID=UPI000994E1F8|nr:DUF2254 domain-containing protein [Priestia abyssalis]